METGNNQENQGNQDPTLDVNLDALSAPEGGYDPFIHGEGSTGEDVIPGGSGIPDALPNLDGNNSGESSEPKGDNFNQNDNYDGGSNPNENPNQGQQNENADQYWMKPFEQIKAANPEWEIPDGITEENYLQTLQEVMSPEPRIHPELQRMQEALDSGVSFDEIAKSFQQSTDALQLSDRDLLANNYKHHYKDWDDTKVNGVLDKLDNAGMLEIEAGKLRNEINESRGRQAETLKAQNEVAYRQQTEQINQERTQQISQSLDIINKAENIYGLEFSQAEKQEFSEYFQHMVTPDKTGTAPMMQALQSNETLVKVAAMLWKGDDKVRSALTNAKESGKAAVFNKLDKSPKSPQRGGGQGDPTQIDFDALSAPERMEM